MSTQQQRMDIQSHHKIHFTIENKITKCTEGFTISFIRSFKYTKQAASRFSHSQYHSKLAVTIIVNIFTIVKTFIAKIPLHENQ